MTTVVFDTRYSEAKELIKKLRNARYAKIIDVDISETDENESILRACLEAEKSENVPESDIMDALK
jgi:hypothetical protein